MNMMLVTLFFNGKFWIELAIAWILLENNYKAGGNTNSLLLSSWLKILQNTKEKCSFSETHIAVKRREKM